MIYFAGQILPYISVLVFILGTLYRVYSWLKTPQPHNMWLAYPNGGWLASIMAEIVVLRSLYKSDKKLWRWAWLMHLVLAAVIIWHVVGIYFAMHQFTYFGLTAVWSEIVGHSLGFLAGLALMIAIISLLYRRFSDDIIRHLSGPADYFALLLLLAIAVTGNYLHMPEARVDINTVRDYLAGLITLQPGPLPDNEVFAIHFILVNILVMYFPFSKMVHIAGLLINQVMLATKPENFRPEANRRELSPFTGSTEGERL